VASELSGGCLTVAVEEGIFVRVAWTVEPLGCKRVPQRHGRVVETARANTLADGGSPREALGFACHHRGEGRVKLRPVIQVCQPRTAERGSWRRSYHLPTFRLCCLNSLPARQAWWDTVEEILQGWFADRSLPKGDSFSVRDLWDVRRALARRIPRPASRARRESWYRAQVAYQNRRRERADVQRREEEEKAHREAVFAILGLNIQANHFEIKQALQRKKREILRDHGSLEELRRVQAAAEEACAFRVSSM